jgi:tripartite ATP-independent transporter DctM subunit
VGPPGPKTTFREKITGSFGMWGVIVVFLVIIGGIFVGVFTPTEAGAFGAFLVIILGLANRKLTWQGFKAASIDTGAVWAMVCLVLMAVMVFNLLLVTTKIPFLLEDIIRGFTQSPIVFMLAVATMLFILGMFVSIMPVSILIIPILHPIALSFGISPLQFAVVFSVICSTGGLSPPFGLNVYAISGMVNIPIHTIFRGLMPFLVAIVICDIILMLVPLISTRLPSLMFEAI